MSLSQKQTWNVSNCQYLYMAGGLPPKEEAKKFASDHCTQPLDGARGSNFVILIHQSHAQCWSLSYSSQCPFTNFRKLCMVVSKLGKVQKKRCCLVKKYPIRAEGSQCFYPDTLENIYKSRKCNKVNVAMHPLWLHLQDAVMQEQLSKNHTELYKLYWCVFPVRLCTSWDVINSI